MADPIELRHREVLNDLAVALDARLNGLPGLPVSPSKVGFCLLVFPFNGADGRLNYISNAEREDMLTALREFIAYHEGRFTGQTGRA